MPTLFAWLGNSDLRASEDASGTDFGLISMALEIGVYDRLVLLSDHGHRRSRDTFHQGAGFTTQALKPECQKST